MRREDHPSNQSEASENAASQKRTQIHRHHEKLNLRRELINPKEES